jgi:hypothetical protein
MRAEPPTQAPVPTGRRTDPMDRPPTPRAQFAHVVVAAGAAVLLGAGPAVAWDLSTQPPRAEARSAWPRPSPWLSAARQMKAAVGGIARIYLPKDKAAPADSGDPASPTLPPSSPAPSATATVGPVVVTHPPHHMYMLR